MIITVCRCQSFYGLWPGVSKQVTLERRTLSNPLDMVVGADGEIEQTFAGRRARGASAVQTATAYS